MFPFAGWWRSLAASVMGLMTGKELQLGAVQASDAHWLDPGLARQCSAQQGIGWELGDS